MILKPNGSGWQGRKPEPETPVERGDLPVATPTIDRGTAFLRRMLMELSVWRTTLSRVHEATHRRQEARIRLLGTRLRRP